MKLPAIPQTPLSRRDFLRLGSLFAPALLLAGCAPHGERLPGTPATQRSLRLLYTNDEHGWLEADRNLDSGGAVCLLRRWKEDEGFGSDEDIVPLSGGDLFVGQALSSASHGEAMIDIMNAMGYRAAALGNHDLDYGVENLRQRAAQASFPLLAANIQFRSTGAQPDFIQPFTVIQVKDVSLGLIGLANTETPVDTRPEAAAEFLFLPYDQALRDVVPQVKAAGAQVLVVLGHLCASELEKLSGLAQELGILVLCGAHCHEITLHAEPLPALVQSGSYLRGYTRIDLNLGLRQTQLLYQPNPPGKEDPELAARVQGWKDASAPDLWRQIGYLGSKIDNRSAEMGNLLARSWLAAYPQAQLILASPRYLHSIPAGDLTPASLVGALPGENTLVFLSLSGQEIVDTVNQRRAVLGGSVSLEALDPQAVYAVLLPDALYHGANRYKLKADHPNALDTEIPWREPVIAWIEAQHSSHLHPLETFLRRPYTAP